VTPCLLAEAIHNRIEISISHVKEVINVVEDLDVCVQIYHLAVLLKLPTTQNKILDNYMHVFRKDINIVKIYACSEGCKNKKIPPKYGVWSS